jgi:hypothetical protein
MELQTNRPFQMTLLECGFLVGALCFCWSVSRWLGEPALCISGYGVTAFAAWRLTNYLSVFWATVVGSVAGLFATIVTILIVYP